MQFYSIHYRIFTNSTAQVTLLCVSQDTDAQSLPTQNVTLGPWYKEPARKMVRANGGTWVYKWDSLTHNHPTRPGGPSPYHLIHSHWIDR